jgi:hypothetical protein
MSPKNRKTKPHKGKSDSMGIWTVLTSEDFVEEIPGKEDEEPAEEDGIWYENSARSIPAYDEGRVPATGNPALLNDRTAHDR